CSPTLPPGGRSMMNSASAVASMISVLRSTGFTSSAMISSAVVLLSPPAVTHRDRFRAQWNGFVCDCDPGACQLRRTRLPTMHLKESFFKKVDLVHLCDGI